MQIVDHKQVILEHTSSKQRTIMEELLTIQFCMRQIKLNARLFRISHYLLISPDKLLCIFKCGANGNLFMTVRDAFYVTLLVNE